MASCFQLTPKPEANYFDRRDISYYQKLNIPLATPIALCALAELEHDSTPLGAARAKARLAQAHAIYTAIEHSAGARETLEAMHRLELDAQALHPETT